MKPIIQCTTFGSITFRERVYEKDIVVHLGGRVTKRKKKLSSRRYGTSHKISLEEAKDILDKRAKRLIIGTGQYGNVQLSKKAANYFRKKGCAVKLVRTPKAVKEWNKAKGKTIGVFHVTC